MLGIQRWIIRGRYGVMHSRLWALFEALEWMLGYLGIDLNDYTYLGLQGITNFAKMYKAPDSVGKRKY